MSYIPPEIIMSQDEQLSIKGQIMLLLLISFS
jgi:hypothetical protein